MANTKTTRRGVSHTPKAPKRKAVAKKPATTKQTRKGVAHNAQTKRPDQNDTPGVNFITNITLEVLELTTVLGDYAANLRALDRQRHNGMGMKRQGFVEAALRIATKFPQYYPHWLNTVKFRNDLSLFTAMRSLVDACRSLEEKAWNINVEASDMVYTDALEYYSQVQDAARRRIDPAETLYDELRSFFKSHGHSQSGEPTEREIKRDMNALLHGRKDGKIVVENFSPKANKGVKKLVDETFKGRIGLKTAENEEID